MPESPSESTRNDILLNSGLTLREHYASLAMQAMISTGTNLTIEQIARWSFAMADGMARESS